MSKKERKQEQEQIDRRVEILKSAISKVENGIPYSSLSPDEQRLIVSLKKEIKLIKPGAIPDDDKIVLRDTINPFKKLGKKEQTSNSDTVIDSDSSFSDLEDDVNIIII
jgi:hypothetical protein